MTTARVDLAPAGGEIEPPSGHLDELDPPSGKLASQVALRIEAEIMRRGWPVGESLGSEVDLRERHGVSRAVLREAVRLVEHHQVARMRRGPNGGLFVCAPDAGPATRAMVIYLEYVGTSIGDLLHARQLLEPLAAALAAERITEDGITRLRQTLDSEQERQAEPGVWSQDPLHVILGELSANPVLHLFIDVLTRLTTRYAHTSRRTSKAEFLAAKGDSHDKHVAIVDAVIAGEGGRAQIRLGEHLDEVQTWLEAHRVRSRSQRNSPSAGAQLAAGPKAKLAEVVAARIHDDIAAQGWRTGTVVGSEADLLDRYGVSRAVLREAVRLLEYHAVARMRRGPGGGLIVSTPEAQASIDTMALYLEFRRVTGEDLRVVRDAIELGTAASVTARRDDPDVAERLQAAARSVTKGPSTDTVKFDLFHTELAELAGNPVLALFLRIITELFRRHTSTQDQLPPGEEAAAEVERVHQQILRAILDGDEGVARHRMRHHLEALTPWWH
jgi:DNA-binding FadR family transcriptional regulator